MTDGRYSFRIRLRLPVRALLMRMGKIKKSKERAEVVAPLDHDCQLDDCGMMHASPPNASLARPTSKQGLIQMDRAADDRGECGKLRGTHGPTRSQRHARQTCHPSTESISLLCVVSLSSVSTIHQWEQVIRISTCARIGRWQ